MAMIQTTRRGFMGFLRARLTGPSSDGTRLAFEIGEHAYKRSGGPKPGLKKAIALHRSSTASK